MTTNQGYAADGRTPLHNVPGRELLVSAVSFNGAVAEIARLQEQVDALAGPLQDWLDSFASHIEGGEADPLVKASRAALAAAGR